MLGGHAMEYGGIVVIAIVILSLILLAMLIYYFKVRSKLDELLGRLLLAGLFLGIHELTFFLGDPFVQELTKTLFFITLFYALVFIVHQNTTLEKNLSKQDTFNDKLKKRLDELKEEIT